MKNEDRIIPQRNESRFRHVLKLQSEQPLPPRLVENYWRVSHIAQTFGMALDDYLLVLIAAMSTHVLQDTPPSFLDLHKQHPIQPESRVIAKYRNKWRWGVYLRFNAEDKVVVKFDDNPGEPRNISPFFVRLPTPDELKEVEK